MKYKIKVRTIWEVGKRKDSNGNPHQEDSLYPRHNDVEETDRLFILCDGMGGHDKGEVASATVCDTMSRVVSSECPDADGPFSDRILQNALAEAFKALDKKDSGGAKKMGTTMTLLKLHSAGYTAAHIGDSRIYHFRPGSDAEETQILFKSEDHSLVNDLIKIGAITEEAAKTHPQRNVITRAMQPHDERLPKADVHHSADIRPGDYFYLCSDGMLEQADDNNLRFFFSDSEAVDTIDKKVKALRLATRENSDNHTAFVIEILSVEGKPTKPEICAEGECPLIFVKDEKTKDHSSPAVNPVPDPIVAGTGPIVVSVNESLGAQNFEEDPITIVSPEPIKRGKKIPVIIYILAGLLIVLLLVIAFFVFSGKKETKADDHDYEDDGRIESVAPVNHSEVEEVNSLPDNTVEHQNAKTTVEQVNRTIKRNAPDKNPAQKKTVKQPFTPTGQNPSVAPTTTPKPDAKSSKKGENLQNTENINNRL